jgi:hypothetical protein
MRLCIENEVLYKRLSLRGWRDSTDEGKWLCPCDGTSSIVSPAFPRASDAPRSHTINCQGRASFNNFQY